MEDLGRARSASDDAAPARPIELIGQNGRGASFVRRRAERLCWPPGRAALLGAAAAVPLDQTVQQREECGWSRWRSRKSTEWSWASRSSPRRRREWSWACSRSSVGPSSGGAARGVVDQTLAMLDGLADEGGRGSLESLGRWNEKRDDRAMPIKLSRGPLLEKCKAEKQKPWSESPSAGSSTSSCRLMRRAGILAISNWKEKRGPHNSYG